MTLVIALSLQAVTSLAPVINPQSFRDTVLPATAKPVVEHIEALFKGDIDQSLRWVSSTVENSVAAPKSVLNREGLKRFPQGKLVAKAMYLAMTSNRKSQLASFQCAPAGSWVRCDMVFGSKGSARNFTIGYLADGKQINKIHSWENHGREAD